MVLKGKLFFVNLLDHYKTDFFDVQLILSYILIFVLPRLVCDNCPIFGKSNIPGNILPYNSYHNRIEINASMYINVCVSNNLQERARHYTKVVHRDLSIKDEITHQDHLWIIDNITPCKIFKLTVQFYADMISPEYREKVHTSTDTDIIVRTAPVLTISSTKLTSNGVEFIIYKNCQIHNNTYYIAELTEGAKFIKNIFIYGEKIEFTGLNRNTSYVLKLTGKHKALEKYIGGSRYVEFKNLLSFQFNTLPFDKGNTSIVRDQNILSLHFEDTIKTINVGKKARYPTSPGFQKFYVKPCEDYTINVTPNRGNSYDIFSKRLTSCGCPKAQSIQIKTPEIDGTTVKLKWNENKIEQQNENFLCGLEDYVVSIDEEQYKTIETSYEISLCNIFDSDVVNVVGFSYEGLVLSTGSIRIPELTEEKFEKLSFAYSQTENRRFLIETLDWSFKEKISACYSEIHLREEAEIIKTSMDTRAQKHKINELKPCSTYNIALDMKGNQQDIYGTKQITIETPVTEMYIKDTDRNSYVELCEYASERLTYYLEVTWTSFRSGFCEVGASDEMKKMKSYQSNGPKVQIDKLIPGSIYKFKFQIYDTTLGQYVAKYEKQIETKGIEKYKVKDLTNSIEFLFNYNNCTAFVNVSWQQPCKTDLFKNYIITSTLNDSSSSTSVNHTSITLQLNCGKTYNICVEAKHRHLYGNKPTVCILVKTLKEPNLDFQPIFKNTGTLTYQISKEVIKSNQDMIENARLELIHMSQKGNCTVNMTNENWNPFKTMRDEYTTKLFDVKNLFPNTDGPLVLRLILSNSLETKQYELVLNQKIPASPWLIPFLTTLCLAIIIIVVIWVLKKRNLCIKTPLQPTIRPNIDIPIDEFVNFMKSQTDKSHLIMEYQSIEQLLINHESTLANIYKPKNRYKNIHPFDYNLVDVSDIPGLAYINASMIKGYDGETQFIATQGPMEETCADFWNMVLGKKVNVIIMLTTLNEGNRVKCAQYYPDHDEELTVDAIVVSCEEFYEEANFERRVLLVKKGEDTSLVNHFKFLKWYDHNVPETPNCLVDFVKMIRNHPYLFPLVVHCSAGVGRTGTFIALWILLDRIQHENKVNVRQVVAGLRNQRVQMVQTFVQYEYIYRCLRLIAEDYSGSKILKTMKAILNK